MLDLFLLSSILDLIDRKLLAEFLCKLLRNAFLIVLNDILLYVRGSSLWTEVSSLGDSTFVSSELCG